MVDLPAIQVEQVLDLSRLRVKKATLAEIPRIPPQQVPVMRRLAKKATLVEIPRRLVMRRQDKRATLVDLLETREQRVLDLSRLRANLVSLAEIRPTPPHLAVMCRQDKRATPADRRAHPAPLVVPPELRATAHRVNLVPGNLVAKAFPATMALLVAAHARLAQLGLMVPHRWRFKRVMKRTRSSIFMLMRFQVPRVGPIC